MDQLEPFRQRLVRAKAIIDVLSREVLDYFAHTHPQRVFLKRDPSRPCEAVIMVELHEALPSHWPLLLGEILHEIRSSLDNLVWFLAESHSGPAPWPVVSPWRRVQFPVEQDPRRFETRTRAWRGLIDATDWAVLESLQPYGGVDPHHLIQIVELSNADKHRSVHLLALYHSDLVNPSVHVAEANDIEDISITVPLEVGACRGETELGRVTWSQTGPNPRLRVAEQLGFEIAIDHPSIVEMDVIGMVMWMQIHGDEVIDAFASRYP